MAQEIIPDKQSVLSCLKQKVYYVDFYQREYVWTKNTVEVLLNDIFYAFEISYKEHKDEEMSQEVLERITGIISMSLSPIKWRGRCLSLMVNSAFLRLL